MYPNNNIEIDDLILRSITEELTSDEEVKLHNWLRESDENRDYYNELREAWNIRDILSIDKNKAYRDLKIEINSRRERGRVLSIIEWWKRAAAILILPLLIYSVYTLVSNKGDNVESTPIYCEVFSPKGVRTKHQLPDSTIIWLNVGSKIIYPQIFSKERREVTIIGEAMLDVSHVDGVPFIVNLDNRAEIEVLGTTFNCSAYQDDSEITTTLIEGKILFSAAGSKVIVTPNSRLTFNGNDITREVVDPLTDIAWRDGLLTFNRALMGDVVKSLQRWYNVDIEIKDRELYNEVISGTFRGESLERILHLLEYSTPIRCEIEHSNGNNRSNSISKIEIYKNN